MEPQKNNLGKVNTEPDYDKRALLFFFFFGPGSTKEPLIPLTK